MRSQSDAQASAEVLEFPRAGFIINANHCGAPSADLKEICLLSKGHEGEHQCVNWEGLRMRLPYGPGHVRFGGFAS